MKGTSSSFCLGRGRFRRPWMRGAGAGEGRGGGVRGGEGGEYVGCPGGVEFAGDGRAGGAWGGGGGGQPGGYPAVLLQESAARRADEILFAAVRSSENSRQSL